MLLTFKKYQEKLKLIFEGMMKFRDIDGLFFWALDTKGFADNSLITASCSIELSRRAYSFLCKNVLQEEDQEDTNFFNLKHFTLQDLTEMELIEQDFQWTLITHI